MTDAYTLEMVSTESELDEISDTGLFRVTIAMI